MRKILVLGAGMIGRAIIKDMAQDYEVKALDISRDNLGKISDLRSVKIVRADVTDMRTIKNYSDDCDLVISAVPGFLGFETLKKIIRCKKNVVDISFFDQDAFELDDLAKKNNITAIVDCGVAPGVSNIILGYHNFKMKINSFECMVGGLPFRRTWPFQYKAPFSPVDVIEEYIRPARVVKDRKVVVKEALSDLEIIKIKSVGFLEAFNTDGLRSLLKTMKIPNMVEKTLRYPGHTEYIKVLKHSGFFSSERISIKGKKIAPIDLTSRLLFPIWKPDDNEEEFTVLKIVINGKERKKKVKYQYDLFDRYDNKAKISSMARTTGYTCTAVSRLILNNQFLRKGICPPEFIGEDKECYEFVMKELKKRGIRFNRMRRTVTNSHQTVFEK